MEPNWILCTDKMPEEHDSIFAGMKGTPQWKNGMFESYSDDVLIIAEYEDIGTREVKFTHTIDGQWRKDFGIRPYKVIAWMSPPEPYIGDRDDE